MGRAGWAGRAGQVGGLRSWRGMSNDKREQIARPMAQSVWEPQLSFVFVTPIAMTIRVLPGAFGLELCRANLPQATLEMNQHVWFCISDIRIFA